MSLQSDLLSLEEGFWTGGPEAYRAHADASCLVAFKELAGPMAREEIAGTAELGRWSDLSMTPKGFSRLADDVAMVVYEARARRKDGHAHHALVSSAYVRREDGWKLAFHQQAVLD